MNTDACLDTHSLSSDTTKLSKCEITTTFSGYLNNLHHTRILPQRNIKQSFAILIVKLYYLKKVLFTRYVFLFNDYNTNNDYKDY